jgi:hypothetical protein
MAENSQKASDEETVISQEGSRGSALILSFSGEEN